MTITTDGIVAFCSAFIAISVVIGMVVRLALVPYLQTHLIKPVAEVRHEVKNTHSTNLRQDIDGVTDQLTALTEAFAQVRIEQEGVRLAVVSEQQKVRAALDQARREDAQWRREHLAYSETVSSRLEAVEAAIKTNGTDQIF